MAYSSQTFTAIDVETTGFSPNRGDRVVEIAVVKVNSDGEIIAQYETLVNPERDPGPTHIHGIKAKDVKDAPLFREIVGDVWSLVDGSTLVAHNAPFDSRFIVTETTKAGVALNETPFLCTLALSRMVDASVECRKLGALCEFYDIPLTDCHSALGDAIATSQLCIKLLYSLKKQGRSHTELGIARCDLSQTKIPTPSGKVLTRKDARTRPTSSYIAGLIARLPIRPDTSREAQSYYAALDAVLEDRLITSHEAESLLQLANDLGLDRNRARQAHRLYVLDLLKIALTDGVVSTAEANDLDEVRQLLCITTDEFDELRVAATHAPASTSSTQDANQLAGRRVCFTGALNAKMEGEAITREQAESMAAQVGMIVVGSVTKSTDILVIADPESQSSKAKTARKYGTRIISEMVFWRLLGTNVD